MLEILNGPPGSPKIEKTPDTLVSSPLVISHHFAAAEQLNRLPNGIDFSFKQPVVIDRQINKDVFPQRNVGNADRYEAVDLVRYSLFGRQLLTLTYPDSDPQLYVFAQQEGALHMLDSEGTLTSEKRAEIMNRTIASIAHGAEQYAQQSQETRQLAS